MGNPVRYRLQRLELAHRTTARQSAILSLRALLSALFSPTRAATSASARPVLRANLSSTPGRSAAFGALCALPRPADVPPVRRRGPPRTRLHQHGRRRRTPQGLCAQMLTGLDANGITTAAARRTTSSPRATSRARVLLLLLFILLHVGLAPPPPLFRPLPLLARLPPPREHHLAVPPLGTVHLRGEQRAQHGALLQDLLEALLARFVRREDLPQAAHRLLRLAPSLALRLWRRVLATRMKCLRHRRAARPRGTGCPPGPPGPPSAPIPLLGFSSTGPFDATGNSILATNAGSDASFYTFNTFICGQSNAYPQTTFGPVINGDSISTKASIPLCLTASALDEANAPSRCYLACSITRPESSRRRWCSRRVWFLPSGSSERDASSERNLKSI
ncbi:hypothetical protein DFH09DRAFT_1491909 [Mycena vulgaris]|nr:hypothetical protein DFH09DRAFT_1491909 [Mycena vulgaris]